jgi:hypothetical protein
MGKLAKLAQPDTTNGTIPSIFSPYIYFMATHPFAMLHVHIRVFIILVLAPS